MGESDARATPEGSPFGHRPEEKVFRSSISRPPTVRVRVAQAAEGLAFEPETTGQAELLRAVLAPKPPAPPPLQFEPDEDEPEAAPGGQHELEGLVELAAGRTSGGAAGAPSLQLPGEDAQASRLRSANEPPLPRGPAPSEAPAASAASPLGPGARPARAGPRSWISVFLSEAVGGRRRRRRSTVFAQRGAVLGAAAARVLERPMRRLRRAYESADRLTSRARLPLANVIWSVLLTALALGLGVAPAASAGFFGTCLVLTVAGHPARNLVGFAGVVIASAAVAEIIRQRERFLEVFLSLFG